jgi:Domain of unknown function (DUF1707)
MVMTDFSNPATANLRLSHAERDEAVASLEASARDGRLSESELSERVGAVRSAVTRGDIAPLFSDLPERADRAESARATPSQPASAAPAPAPHESYEPQPFRWRPVLQYVTPALTLILFFLTGWIWGFQYSWIWFLLVPVAWGLSRGVDGRDHER